MIRPIVRFPELTGGTKYLSYLGFPTSRDVLKSLPLTTSLCASHIGVQHGVPLSNPELAQHASFWSTRNFLLLNRTV
ncbi:hypothetical protein WJX82_006402 [Trebouxia sp. C0006]